MKDFCDITIVLDRSSSMSVIREATVEGLNKFINEQKEVPGDGCWSLVQFDDHASAEGAKEEFPNTVFSCVPQDKVKYIEYEDFKPRGYTALIDAVCMTIDKIGARLRALPESERPNKVLVIIMTDGQENSSRKFTRDQMAQRISHQQADYNWVFLFLGANQDAIAVGQSYGIPTHMSKTYDHTPIGTSQALGFASAKTRSWKLDGLNEDSNLLSSAAPDKDADPQNINISVQVKT